MIVTRYLTILTALLLVPPFYTAAAALPEPPPHVVIPVWVEPQPDSLTPQEFAITLNGKPEPVLNILNPDSDLVILLVLDLTGDISLIDAAKQALAAQVMSLPENAWVGLLRAQDGLSVIADPTPDRNKVSELINTLPVSGNPGLLDTVKPVSKLADALLRKSAVRTAILYITDGDIYHYREDFTNPVINSSDPHDLSRRFPEAIIQERISRLQVQIAPYQAPLFIVDLQHRTSSMNQAYQNGLKTLSEFTAGYGSFCRSDAEIPDAIAKVFAYIRSSWFLNVRLPRKSPGALQVRLQLSELKQSHVAYRARLLLKGK